MEGWIRVYDPSSSAYYFWNQETQESTWDEPAAWEDVGKGGQGWSEVLRPELKAALMIQSAFRIKQARKKVRQQRAKATIESQGEEERGWVTVRDPVTGFDYYYHTETAEVTWDKPEALASNDCTKSVEEWCKAIDEETGMEYYYNTTTGEAQWEPPSEVGNGVANLNSIDSSRASELKAKMKLALEGKLRKVSPEMLVRMKRVREEQLNAEKSTERRWCEVYDPSSDAFYYYDVITYETVWEKPIDFVMASSDELLHAALTLQGTFRMNKAKKEALRKKAELSLDVLPSTLGVWIRFKEKAKGYDYFFHRETHEVSWSKPSVDSSEIVSIESLLSLTTIQDEFIDRTGAVSEGLESTIHIISIESNEKEKSVVAHDNLEQELEREIVDLCESKDETNSVSSVPEGGKLSIEKQIESSIVTLDEPKRPEEKTDCDSGKLSLEEPIQHQSNDSNRDTAESFDKQLLCESAQNDTANFEESKGLGGFEHKGKLEEVPTRNSVKIMSNEVETEKQRPAFRSNQSIREMKRKKQETQLRQKEILQLQENAQTVELSIELCRDRLVRAKQMFRKLDALLEKKNDKELGSKASAVNQSFRVSELPIREAYDLVQKTKQLVQNLDQENPVTDCQEIVKKAIRSVVFAEAQLVVAVRSFFTLTVSLFEKVRVEFNDLSSELNASGISTNLRLRRLAIACASGIRDSLFKIKMVDESSHQRVVSEAAIFKRKARLENHSPANFKDEEGFAVQLERIEAVEKRLYDRYFQEFLELVETRQSDDGVEIETSVPLASGGQFIESPWWASYQEAIMACLWAREKVSDTQTTFKCLLERAMEQRECRLMLAEEATQRAFLAEQQGIEFELNCRRGFVEMCRNAWQKGLKLKKSDRLESRQHLGKHQNQREEAGVKGGNQSRSSLVRKDKFRSPWDALEHNCSFEEFVDSVEEIRRRFIYQEKRNFDIDRADLSSGRTLLHAACWHSRVDVVKYLLEQGANANACRGIVDPTTALHLAVRVNSPDLVKLLLKHGARLTSQDIAGETALHWACRVESLGCVRALVDGFCEPSGREDGTAKKRSRSSCKALCMLNLKGRTPSEVLPINRKRNADELSYHGKRIYEFIRPLEIQAQRELLSDDFHSSYSRIEGT